LEKSSTVTSGSRNYVGTQQAQNVRRDGPSNLDILARGRQMGMKLWAAEKLQRILAHMFDEGATHGHNTRGNNIAVTTVRAREEDLSQVLRNEKHNGLADRDPSAFTKDLVLFKGPFIYIHDMDGKTRPTMVREYPKVARRQDGAWPQFRSATVGKCPFVEDHMSKKELEREREKEKERALALQLEREAQQAHKTRSVSAFESVQMDPPRRTSPRKALREVSNVPNGPSLNLAPPQFSKLISPPKVKRHTALLPATAEAPAIGFIRPVHMHFAGEPAASGIQQSNLTSAIRSNMISSTAAAPGAKAGTSREVHELKRKVLERSNTGSLSVGSMPSSHRMTDLAGHLRNARAPAPQRAAKSKAQEKLGGVQEEDNPSEDELAAERAALVSSRKKRAAKKDPKPGYCENCRDKYDDFDEVSHAERFQSCTS
jgi:regulatory subunit for Cdc7p protein kinase